jgi:thymidylate synthase ThyX
LQHFLKLRTKSDAHFQIRELALNLYKTLPDTHKYLFEECITHESK